MTRLTTLPPTSSAELGRLNDQLRDCDERVHQALEQVAEIGDDDSAHEAHAQRLARHQAEGRRLRAKRDELLAGAGTASDSTSGRPDAGLLSLQFAEDGLRGLHASLLRHEPGFLPSVHAITTGDFDPSAEPFVDYAAVDFLRERTRVASLFPAVATDRGSVEWFKVETAASAAEAIGEGDPKPESTPTVAKDSVPIRKIGRS